jgi:hypothetical protein
MVGGEAAKHLSQPVILSEVEGSVRALLNDGGGTDASSRCAAFAFGPNIRPQQLRGG